MTPSHSDLMIDAYNWGRNWSTLPGMPKSKDYVSNAMAESWEFDKWNTEFKDEFWRGFADGPHEKGKTIPVISQSYDFKRG